MFNFIRNWLNHRIIKNSTITDQEWGNSISLLPILQGLTENELQRLKELSILFIDVKEFEGARGLIVSQHMILTIALQACLPILNLGLSKYKKWYTIILYPATFVTNRSVTDENGIVNQERSSLLGEAWHKGPVILAWDETETAGIIDGHNLVIHEFAHKLDMQNGVANGFPPLNFGMKRKDWVNAFTRGFEHFQKRCHKNELYGISCYGATSPAEFFSVISEVFFEKPKIIDEHYPDIYKQLCLYYRQSPIERLPDII
ncbi:MAG: zinc-dependent peptidase [Gammaproteobacteria bacterium]|nr:zinc-dependent peptidase [Gammaproteobacteria bacterium]